MTEKKKAFKTIDQKIRNDWDSPRLEWCLLGLYKHWFIEKGNDMETSVTKKQLIEAALIDGFWLRHSLGGASDGDFSEAVVNVKYVVRDIIHQYSI